MSKTDKELLKLELIRQLDNKLAFSDWMRMYHSVRFFNPSINNPDDYLESRKFIHTGLRIHGSNDIRKVNNESLKSILNELGINYTIISGNYNERFEKSINHTNKILQM